MKRSDIHLNARQLINGRWETGVTTGLSDNPSAPGEVVAEYARADRSQTDLAVRAAADALRAWRLSTPQRRADVLDQIGSEILARKDELGLLLAREQGRTLPEAVAEAARAGRIFKFFAGEALHPGGQGTASVRSRVQVDVTREPVGVVALIAPWTCPLAIPARQIAPALAGGNTVVFKPAEWTSACGWALADIVGRAALPAGAFNLVMGSGREVGQALVDHPQVDALSFTGSVATGDGILKAAAARRASVQLDTGGNNALVVLADADLDRAVDCAVQGAFLANGQRCTATCRVIVEAAVHDGFVGRLRQHTQALRVGHALEAGIDIGPLVDRSLLERNLAAVDAARHDGAELLWGGERLQRPGGGHCMSPALFLAQPGHRVAREEIFGPVACVLRAEDYAHALALANDAPDSVCAGICTGSLEHAMHFRQHAKAGTTMVNLPTSGVDDHTPRARGRAAAEFYTTAKTGYMLA